MRPALHEVTPENLEKNLCGTGSYVPRIDVEGVSDLVVVKAFDGIQEIQRKLGIPEVDFKYIAGRERERFTHLVISRRFDFTSPGTKILSFFSSERLLPGEAFWTLPTNVTASKLLSLWFNSTFAVIELLLSQRETRGSFIDITLDKIQELHVPNISKCETKQLLDAFEQVRDVEFPPIFEQFENPPEARKIIDRAVLKTISYSDNDTEEILSELYKAMATELRSWKELMHQSSAKEKESTPQLHLFANE